MGNVTGNFRNLPGLLAVTLQTAQQQCCWDFDIPLLKTEEKCINSITLLQGVTGLAF